MDIRVLEARAGKTAVVVDSFDNTDPAVSWSWVDIEVGTGDTDELVELTATLALDPLAVRDAIEDVDLPKSDDFGSSLLVVLHELAEGRIATHELDCFLTETRGSFELRSQASRLS